MTRADHDESIGVMDSPEPNFSLICENACKNENEVHMIRKLVSFYINPDFSIANFPTAIYTSQLKWLLSDYLETYQPVFILSNFSYL